MSRSGSSSASSSGIEWVLIVGGALMIIGSFLPWWQARFLYASVDRNGMQLGNNLSFSVDGLLTILFGCLVALIGITNLTGTRFPRWFQRSPIVLGAVGLVDAVSSYQSISSAITSEQASNSSGSYSIGFGLWLVMAGGPMRC